MCTHWPVFSVSIEMKHAVADVLPADDGGIAAARPGHQAKTSSITRSRVPIGQRCSYCNISS